MNSFPKLKTCTVEESLMIVDLVRKTSLFERFDVDIQVWLGNVMQCMRVVIMEWYKKMAGLQETSTPPSLFTVLREPNRTAEVGQGLLMAVKE